MLRLKLCSEPQNLIKLSASITIGRDEANDLVLPSLSVSDFHAEIDLEKEVPIIIDLLSATGTFVNDKRINQRTVLKAWDLIRLGSVELEINDSSTTRPGDWVLRASSNSLANLSYALQKTTVVGRGTQCDLSIDCDLLSREHAEITIEQDHLYIRDLGSANGTYLNGNPIEEGNAFPGDELRFDQRAFMVVGPTPTTTRLTDPREDITLLREYSQTEEEQWPPQAVNPNTTLTRSDELQQEEITHFSNKREDSPAFLVEESGLLTESRLELTAEHYSLGRSPTSDIVFAEKSVSKRHAQLSCIDQQWIIEDCDSQNGTTVNGQKVASAMLDHGDCIDLGRIKLIFVNPMSADSTSEVATTVIGRVANQNSRATTTSIKCFTLARPWGIALILGLLLGTTLVVLSLNGSL
jgi:pSer/pThr/pTyr-binding forkhead associated (FHA) protein